MLTYLEVTFHQQNAMLRAQGHLKDGLREMQPFRRDAAGVALPGVEATSLSTAIVTPGADRHISLGF